MWIPHHPKARWFRRAQYVSICSLICFAGPIRGDELGPALAVEEPIILDRRHHEKLREPQVHRTLGDHAGDEVINIFVQVTRNQNSKNQVLRNQAKALQPLNDSDYLLKVSAFRAPTDRQLDASSNDVGEELGLQANKVIAEIASKKLGFIEAFKKGLSFDFDVSSLFGNKKPKQHSQAQPVTYGLVLKDIDVPEEKNPQAALRRSTDLSGSIQAKPVWTIAPIKPQARTRPFHADVPAAWRASNQRTTEKQKGIFIHGRRPEPTAPSIYQRFLSMIRPPQLKFKGKMTPIQTTGSNPLNSGWKISMQQVQNLYAIDMITNHLLKSTSVEHRMNLPLVGAARLTRTYDENMSVKATTVQNVLVLPELPSVFVTHLDASKQYKAGLQYGFGDHQITFSAESPVNWDPSEIGTAEGEKYHLNYTLNF